MACRMFLEKLGRAPPPELSSLFGINKRPRTGITATAGLLLTATVLAEGADLYHKRGRAAALADVPRPASSGNAEVITSEKELELMHRGHART
ncbi:hypothetical protein EVAR_23016_1 [Eumeta japonica]|uniref:Uncharacterized protein n=1 Tax=Eumeta variegata TaxID=151549 RepID=A0A4C1UQ15_EUMVA|nr:hypothetical protein EVAR_23016_1 [Eumeta japonica]